MATSVTIDYLSALTNKHFVTTMVDNVFLHSPILYFLRKKEVVVDGGEDIRIPIQHSRSQKLSRWGGRAETVESNLEDHISTAVFPYAKYKSSITLTEEDIAKNKGKAKIVDIIEAQTQVEEMTLRDNMGIDAFLTGAATETANAQLGLLGLNSVLTFGANPTGITGGGVAGYGGITRVGASGQKNSPTGNSFWNGNVAAANGNTTYQFYKMASTWDASATLTTAKMQEMFGVCSQGQDKPTHIFCSQGAYNKYWSLLTAIQRQMTDDEVGKIGFDNLLFNNKPVIVDDNIDAAGSMYFINMNTFEWKPLKGFNFDPTDFARPANQRTMVKLINFIGQMVCKRPNQNGKISGLTF